MPKFSDVLMDHFTHPRNSGHMDGADKIGLVGEPGRGPFFILYLRIDGDRIVEARFQTHGCGTTIAAGSMLTELLKDKSLAECQLLTAEELCASLGGMPPTKQHSPALAIAALHAALAIQAESARD